MRISRIICLVAIGNQSIGCSSENINKVRTGSDVSSNDKDGLGIGTSGGSQNTHNQQVWVDCLAAKNGNGTQKSKFNNLFSAQNTVRGLLKDTSRTGHIYVNVIGDCRLTTPLVFRAEDSGLSATRQAIWRGEATPGTPSGWARILGSSRVNFAPKEKQKSTWEADIPPEALKGRDLYIMRHDRSVSKERGIAVRAYRRAISARTAAFNLDEKRFLAIGRATNGTEGAKTCPTAGSPFKLKPDTAPGGEETLPIASETDVPAGSQLVLMRAFGMERFPMSSFRIPSQIPKNKVDELKLEIPVDTAVGNVVCGNDGGGWGEKAPPWTAWFENLSNSKFMNDEGEWALVDGKANYIPKSNDFRAGELAHQKNLIIFDNAKYMTLMDFEMAFTTWDNNYAYKTYRQTSVRTFRQGVNPIVPQFESEPAAIQLTNSNNIIIQKNAFRHLGGSGIQLIHGSRENTIQGNLMLDIGITAIEVDARAEVMAKGNTQKENAASNNDKIENNLIAQAGEKDWGGMGILIGFAEDLKVMNNHILKSSYAGISSSGTLRNCWTVGRPNVDPTENCWNRKNIRIEQNIVERAMARSSDGGALYVNGQQPGTTVKNNIVIMRNLNNDPNGHFVTGLYFDTGSTGITAVSNQIPDPLGAGIHFNKYANESGDENGDKKAVQHLGLDQNSIREQNKAIKIERSEIGLQGTYKAWLTDLYERWIE